MTNHHQWTFKLGIMLWLVVFELVPANLSQAMAQTRSIDVDRAFANATRLHETGDVEGAIREYQAILKLDPRRVDVRSNLGAAYSGRGRYEDAIEQYKLALGIDSGNQTVRRNLALAYYKAALFTEAAAELTRFVAATPEGSEYRNGAVLLLADCFVRLGEYKKVIELLAPLEERDPNNRTIAYVLGSALIGDGQMSRGQLLIDRVFRGDDSAEGRLLIGSILLLADDGLNAIKELEKAIELNPKLPTVRAWYGRALMRMGDSERARNAFKSELSDNPNDFDANLFMGILLKQDKSLDEAFGYLSRAIRLRPRDSYARYHLGALYATTGKVGEARVLLEDVVKEYPDFVEARVLLASVYYRVNRRADGDRERAIVDKLNREQQSKQPGAAQDKGVRVDPPKPTKDPQDRKPRNR
ncbi:MAG TPA: tetratricopeptide repeat protein [Blastocatellia bacterium]|nr:tetratricopeptide repeat protein [Blastocatellia bacterium]